MPPSSPYVKQAIEVAKKYRLPVPAFLSLVQHESGWNPSARSPAGAIGLTQLMPGTASGLGVNPNDPVQNLEGGARYLRDQMNSFGSLNLALAAYNAGPNAVRKYGGIPPYAETQAYVRGILGDSGGAGVAQPPPANTASATSPIPTPGLPSRPARPLTPSRGISAGIDPQALALLNQTNKLVGLAPLPPIFAGAISNATGYLPPPPKPVVAQKKNGAPARAPIRTAAADYPLAKQGNLIGLPYQGTHTMYGNWESDNAVDISIPAGTPVYALWSGKIGPQIGPLGSGDPRLEGQRLHLVGKDEAYYAHLSKIVVKKGQTVKAGQLLGYSGVANGTPHLHLATRDRDPRSYVA